MAKMKSYETKKVKVTPRKGNSIPDILIKNQTIDGETTMNMNAKEIKRVMHYGSVAGISESGTETSLNPRNFDDNSNGVIFDPSAQVIIDKDDGVEYSDEEIRIGVNNVLYGSNEKPSGDK